MKILQYIFYSHLVKFFTLLFPKGKISNLTCSPLEPVPDTIREVRVQIAKPAFHSLTKRHWNIFLATAAFGILSCGGNENQHITQLPVVPVIVDVAALVTTEGSFSASGKIEAINSANLSTRMMGNVTKLHVSVGEKLKTGQLLVSINNADLRAKKAQVLASIHQAESVLENAKKDYERFQSLFEKGSASEKELDNMTTRYEMANAGLQGANQVMKEINAQFVFTNISAPFDGVVVNTFIKEGDIASPGMPLVAVEGTSKYQAVVMVPETQIIQVKKGAEANVVIKSSGKKIIGKVSEVSLSAKNTRGQYLVKIDLVDAGKDILPGMFVNVALLKTDTSQSASPAIQEKALVRNGQLGGVYTIGDDKTAILRWLRLGKNVDGKIEVLSGIKPGEKYIVSADGKLFNGAKVQVSNKEETAFKN
jgi:RND family efflux transporter MFP subunit